jgi:transcriptional regulator with GAF, ATPase, and Fis domain
VILSSGDALSVDESWFSNEASRSISGSRCQFENDEKSNERKIIETALVESRGRIAGPSGAAAKLKVPRSTLESRIKTLKIRKSQFKFAAAVL